MKLLLFAALIAAVAIPAFGLNLRYRRYPNAARTRIPGARFVSLESGGHVMLGQIKIVRDELTAFFAHNPRHIRLVATREVAS